MARPSIEDLCGLDTTTLPHLPHGEASKIVIDACIKKKRELADVLREIRTDEDISYESLSAVSTHIKYLNRAIEVRTREYEKMGTINKDLQRGQSKKHTHYEVSANQIIGFMMGWSIVYFIFPLLKDLTAFELASVSSILFFISSYSRTYSLRRLFNMIAHTDMTPLLKKLNWRRS